MSVYATRAGKETLSAELNGADDRLFIDQRFDGRTLHEGTYLNCTFANVSFLRSRLERARFTACVFEACYFRETTLKECTFSASRFIDCEFVKPNIVACDFRNARFKGCYPPFGRLQECLPGEPNLRATLTSNLAFAAESAGDTVEARKYLLESMRANEEHLLAAFRARTDYYRSHFPSSLDRILALVSFGWSRANGFIWGHGERGAALLRTVLIVVFIVWPALLWLARQGISDPVGHQANIGDIFWLSAASLIGNSAVTGLNVVGVARVVVLAEQAVGLLLFGLFVTYVYRYVTRR
jgi:hypothetical protein